ncbi:hypothetical protein AAFF_G00302380 [Aldrovandia affinis]|uniref:SH3 domain-containing protein n=1 Tax=Aldrovandia affinis TaxID=143900 RepID=A0AAD7R8G3_9TELE|nr:hypothetical protein AAFF_G00302380 [Aldrovandia affinis]
MKRPLPGDSAPLPMERGRVHIQQRGLEGKHLYLTFINSLGKGTFHDEAVHFPDGHVISQWGCTSTDGSGSVVSNTGWQAEGCCADYSMIYEGLLKDRALLAVCQNCTTTPHPTPRSYHNKLLTAQSSEEFSSFGDLVLRLPVERGMGSGGRPAERSLQEKTAALSTSAARPPGKVFRAGRSTPSETEPDHGRPSCSSPNLSRLSSPLDQSFVTKASPWARRGIWCVKHCISGLPGGLAVTTVNAGHCERGSIPPALAGSVLVAEFNEYVERFEVPEERAVKRWPVESVVLIMLRSSEESFQAESAGNVDPLIFAVHDAVLNPSVPDWPWSSALIGAGGVCLSAPGGGGRVSRLGSAVKSLANYTHRMPDRQRTLVLDSLDRCAIQRPLDESSLSRTHLFSQRYRTHGPSPPPPLAPAPHCGAADLHTPGLARVGMSQSPCWCPGPSQEQRGPSNPPPPPPKEGVPAPVARCHSGAPAVVEEPLIRPMSSSVSGDDGGGGAGACGGHVQAGRGFCQSPTGLSWPNGLSRTMFLTVYLSNNDQHFTEVPVTPETLCRDVVELCKEPGEGECHLAEMWRGSERAVGEAERMLDVLQRWGQQRAEVRFFLRHDRPPGRDSGGSRAPDHLAKRNGVKGPTDRHMENGVAPPRMDMTLNELQEMASRQQQQIDAQQQLLASKEQRLRYLKQQDQRQSQVSEQEKLQRLRENAEGQEARLKKVRALKGQVEQKRLSNGKLAALFQQKQRELVVAVTRVEELSRQLEMLKNGKMDAFHDNQSSAAELDRLYKELQLRNRLNQEQSAKLQQQRESLNKRNLEVAAMDRRVSELRERLWKKKAALQQKENLPNGFPVKDKSSKGTQQVPSDGHPPQQGGPSRVAAVGPYIQSSTMPRGPIRHELLVKPAYPDATATLPSQDGPLKAPPRGAAKPPSGERCSGGAAPIPRVEPACDVTLSSEGAGLHTAKVSKFSEWSNSSTESSGSHGSSSTLPRMASHAPAEQAPEDAEMLKREKDKKVRPFSMLDTSEPSGTSLRKNQSSDDLLRDTQVSLPGPHAYGKPTLNAGTFPGKARSANQQQHHHRGPAPSPSHSHTLPLPAKQEAPPAAKVRPFTPEPGPQALHKPQTLATSSIYSMYTQRPTIGKSFQPPAPAPATATGTGTGTGMLTRTQPRVYGKPVIPGGGQQPPYPDNPYQERPAGGETDAVDHGGSAPSGQEGPEISERTPRPLSPTKLLPFISNPYRHQSDVDLEALRKKLYHAPRPLKKRSSITEPEGPAGPNIQKLLYQKTTLAAMETITNANAPFYQPRPGGPTTPRRPTETSPGGPLPSQAPPPRRPPPPPPPPSSERTPLPPSRPAPTPQDPPGLSPPGEEEEEEEEGREEGKEEEERPQEEGFVEEYPPYPPPPYPSAGEQDGVGEEPLSLQAPEVTGQVPLPPVSTPPRPTLPRPAPQTTARLRSPETVSVLRAFREMGKCGVAEVFYFCMVRTVLVSLKGAEDSVSSSAGKRTNLRKVGSERIDHGMRVKFNPLALLLDSSLEGEYDLVQRIIYEVEDPSLPNDEGITALHNAVCAGHTEIVKFLVQFGVNVNAADSDGWTPLHCAASCNNVQVCKFLVESGAAVFASTYSDMQTAADKCEEMEEGYTQCSQFLYGVQEKMGIMNRGVVYGLWDYAGESEDELPLREGDCMTVVRREDEDEVEWWWARAGDAEGYIPRNLLGLYPRIKQRQRSLA